ncbi:MAG: RNA signal recognition particle [Gammaproteobacteria bacterium]|nr:MAG: RNA signal recognition particle [Gammaproteobacteria bacterium]
MSHYSGFLMAVPTANKQTYLDHVREAWPVLSRHGALRLIETWGVSIPDGELTDMKRAVQAQDEEAVVFAWIEWPDRATADAAWANMENDPDMKTMSMPCDCRRMIFGLFETLFDSAQEG